MGETESRIKNVGRILPYEEADPNETLLDFKRRILEQVRVIRIAIKSGDVNDSSIAENYAKKAERFVEITYFTDKSNKDKKVHHLKSFLKVKVGEDKELIKVLKEWIKKKREFKVIFAETFLDFPKSKGFNYVRSLRKFHDEDIEFLSKAVIPQYESEFILLTTLMAILKSKETMNYIGVKNSWKVATFKTAIIELNKKEPFKESYSFEDIIKLPYFRYKKYLELTFAEFKDLVGIRLNILLQINVRLSQWLHEIEAHKENIDGSESGKTVADMLGKFDNYLNLFSDMQKKFEREYSLYRYGQGLIEADIFKNLFI